MSRCLSKHQDSTLVFVGIKKILLGGSSYLSNKQALQPMGELYNKVDTYGCTKCIVDEQMQNTLFWIEHIYEFLKY